MEIEELKRLFRETRKSKKGLAKALGFENDSAAVSKILSGRREIKAREVPLIRAYFEGKAHEEFTSNVTPSSQKPPSPSSLRVNDVPLLGTSSAGRDGDFSFNGQVIDYVVRGPGIMTKKDIYALYVQGESMVPWKESGECIYVDPNKPVRDEDYVVVELLPAHEGDPKPAFVKRLITKTGKKIRLRQYNPTKEIEFDLDRVVTCHHVLTQQELLNG